MKLLKIGQNLNLTLDDGQKMSKKEPSKEKREEITFLIKDYQELQKTKETKARDKKLKSILDKIISYFTQNKLKEEETKKVIKKAKKAATKAKGNTTKVTSNAKNQSKETLEAARKLLKDELRAELKEELKKEILNEMQEDAKTKTISGRRKSGNEYW